MTKTRISRDLVKVTLFGWLSVGSTAHDAITTPLTFSREISRVLYSRCASCHREGGSAFSLLTYQEARPWAAAMKEEVLERRMPPWGAIKGFGEFRDDDGLTQEQIGLIADWVEGGAPEGDSALLPKAPESSPAAGGVAADNRDRRRNLRASSKRSEIAVDGALTLRTALTISGIRPGEVRPGSTLMVTAVRPDGSVEPLLWLYQYNPRFKRAYVYNAALRFVPGTRIEVAPRDAGSVALLMQR